MVEVSPIVCPMSAGVARAQRVFLVAPQEPPRASQAPPAAVMQCLAPPPVQPQQILQPPQQHLQQQQQRVVLILQPEIPALQHSPPPLPTLPNQPLPPSSALPSAKPTTSSGANVAAVGIAPTSPNPAIAAGKSATDALLLPLDLSTKVRHDSAASNSSNSFFDIGLGPRTSSCSSTSSRSSVMSDEERRMKRKEQNKAAAHNYRQRKKSFSDLIESEHEMLCKRNEELKARKARLESQIKNMRTLLDQAAKKEARQAELQKERQAAAAAATAAGGGGERKRNLSAMAAIGVPPPLPAAAAPLSLALLPPPPPPPPPSALSISIRPRSMSDVSPLMLPQHPVGPEDIFRERKNTWPLGPTAASPAAAAVARERKKEQNKLASRRFRQRRRMEMTHCEAEGHRLEARNRRLREACEELESKIRLLKDLMNNRPQQQQKQQQQAGAGSGDGGKKNCINAMVEANADSKNPPDSCGARVSQAPIPSTSSTTTPR